jgi:hypothetical protein
MEAEQYADRGGTSIELEHDAWLAAEDLVLQAREDVERLNTEIERLADGRGVPDDCQVKEPP